MVQCTHVCTCRPLAPEALNFKSIREALRVTVGGWIRPCDKETATLTATPQLTCKLPNSGPSRYTVALVSSLLATINLESNWGPILQPPGSGRCWNIEQAPAFAWQKLAQVTKDLKF